MTKFYVLLMIVVLCGCDAHTDYEYREAIQKKDCSLIRSGYRHPGSVACEIHLLNQTLKELLKAQNRRNNEQ